MKAADHRVVSGDGIELVLTTFGTEADAIRVIRALVEEGLAACGTMLPGARSVYRWNGVVEDAPEWMVIFKVASCCRERFAARLADLHPYEVPEMVFLGPSGVSAPYRGWLLGEASG